MSAIVNADASDGDGVQITDAGDGDVQITPTLKLRRPIYCMAPMVGQSDRPFRLLCRRHGTTLCYSEMIMSDEFASSAAYRLEALGDRVRDHPLIVQFAANEPDAFARAAVAAHAMGAAGADLNIGCPQRRAREGVGFVGGKLDDERVITDARAKGFVAIRRRRRELVGHQHLRVAERGAVPATEQAEWSIRLADHRRHAVDGSP